MRTIRLHVPAKVNVCLRVGPANSDGYHSLATVYQAVSVYDEIVASARDDDQIVISVDGSLDEGVLAKVPKDDSNLAYRAADLTRRTIGKPGLGIDLSIFKAIPVAGGMAGGSADAAAALVACNIVWKLGLAADDLEALAAELGSDVPFLLHGGTAMGSGHGEVVTPVMTKGTYHWVFVTSAEGLSTAEMYGRLDVVRPDAETPRIPPGLLEALRAGDPEKLAGSMINDLGPVALGEREDLRHVVEMGFVAGALDVIVSGSGPTIALLARSAEHAEECALLLGENLTGHEILVAHGPVPGVRPL